MELMASRTEKEETWSLSEHSINSQKRQHDGEVRQSK